MDKREYSESSRRLYLRENTVIVPSIMLKQTILIKLARFSPMLGNQSLGKSMFVCVCAFVGI